MNTYIGCNLKLLTKISKDKTLLNSYIGPVDNLILGLVNGYIQLLDKLLYNLEIMNSNDFEQYFSNIINSYYISDSQEQKNIFNPIKYNIEKIYFEIHLETLHILKCLFRKYKELSTEAFKIYLKKQIYKSMK